MTITALPTPPLRSDPTNFAARADTFLAALPTFQTEANALEVNVNAKEAAADGHAIAASDSADLAAAQVALAAAQTGLATAQAALAQAAALSAGSIAWVSGTTYAVGDLRYSPVNFKLYRRTTAGAGATDPSADATNWMSAVLSEVTLGGTETLTNKRITARVLSAASYTTDTGTSLNCDTLDEFIVTAQAGALLLNNPTGTPTDGQVLLIAITGTAARALTWGTQFQASTMALPTTTVTTARLNMGFIWAAATSKWICVGAV